MKPNLGDCSAAPSPPPAPAGLRRGPVPRSPALCVWHASLPSPGAVVSPERRSLYPVRARHCAPSRVSVADVATSALPHLSLPVRPAAGRSRHSPRVLPSSLRSRHFVRPGGPAASPSGWLCAALRSGRPSGPGRGWGQRLPASPPSATEAALPFKVFLREAGTIVQLLRWSV